MNPESEPLPAVSAQATARARAAESRIEEPELWAIVTAPAEMLIPTTPDGFCKRASFDCGYGDAARQERNAAATLTAAADEACCRVGAGSAFT